MAPKDGTCPGCGNLAGISRYCSECGMRLAPEVDVGTALVPARRFTTQVDRPRRHEQVVWSVGLLGPDSEEEPPATPSGAAELISALARRVPRMEWQLNRHDLARRLLALARGSQPLEHIRLPGEVAAAYLRRYDSRRATQEAYAWDLADWFVWLQRAGIDPFEATLATVESYAREPLAKGNQPALATVARRLACLSGFYRRSQYAGLVDRNPVQEAHRPKVPEPAATLGLSKVRARDLLGAARGAGPRETLLVLMMLELGLRVSEAVGADIEDLGEQGRHRVLAIRGKGQATKATRVPLNPALIEAVARATAGRASGPLLVTSTGRRLTRQHAGKLIRQLGEHVGVEHLHPHELRHAFVTLALDEGETLRDVQDAARHADPRTTRRYDNNRNSLDRHPTHRLLEALEPERNGFVPVSGARP